MYILMLTLVLMFMLGGALGKPAFLNPVLYTFCSYDHATLFLYLLYLDAVVSYEACF